MNIRDVALEGWATSKYCILKYPDLAAEAQRVFASDDVAEKAILRAKLQRLGTADEAGKAAHRPDDEREPATPTGDDQTEAAKTGNQAIPEPLISVDVDAAIVTVDGRAFGLNGSTKTKERVAEFISLLIEKDGEYVARPPNIKTHNIETQPSEVAELIEAQPGAGSRIPRDKIWRN